MYTPEEFDSNKTRVMEYVLYKKRTEYEVRKKFCHSIEENMLNDIIEHIKSAGYINDDEYICKLVNEYVRLKTMSIREIKNKLYAKGIYADTIEEYIEKNRETLEDYELNSATKLIEKKSRTSEPKKVKVYLLNKGFDPEILNKISYFENV